MPSILKRFMRPSAEDYILPPAEELKVEVDTPPPPPPPPTESPPVPPPPAGEAPVEEDPRPAPQNPIDYAEVQAEAILEDARREAQLEREAAWEDFQKELDKARSDARQEGYDQGYAAGMAQAMQDGRAQLEDMAREQTQAVEAFLEGAARSRDRILDESREELKDLALAIAEKVIRVSLRGSSDILRRMVETATEKKKRCEWAHIYVADCDVRGSANTIPELCNALRGISDRVRVVPMADDESGTCIIEMPDEIVDASVSTQLGNIRETVENASLDEDDEPVLVR